MKLRILPRIVPLLAALTLQAEEPPAARFATHGYAEYLPGDLPVIIAAPHGGRLTPDSIPDRTGGVRDIDQNTQELARTAAEVIHERTGGRVHLILCLLHRSKLDANRELPEAAEGHAEAEQAWREYHAFIEEARAAVVARYGAAFVIDLHGHGHPGRRLELGYRHSTEDLAKDDEAFTTPEAIAESSLQLIAERRRQPYPELLRGAASLGALFEAEGFSATPSPSAPHPVAPYFRGGYTVARHCVAAEHSTGLQIECYREGLRDTAENRLAFAHALTVVLEQFLPAQLGLSLRPAGKGVAGSQGVREAASQ